MAQSYSFFYEMSFMKNKRCGKKDFGSKFVYLCGVFREVVAMKNNDWKERLNIVYSTNPDFCYETETEPLCETLPKSQQRLRVSIERHHRGGKVVTLIKGFVGTGVDLKELGKKIKIKCGVGGTVKDGEIVIQGDFKTRVIEILKSEGYNQTK